MACSVVDLGLPNVGSYETVIRGFRVDSSRSNDHAGFLFAADADNWIRFGLDRFGFIVQQSVAGVVSTILNINNTTSTARNHSIAQLITGRLITNSVSSSHIMIGNEQSPSGGVTNWTATLASVISDVRYVGVFTQRSFQTLGSFVAYRTVAEGAL